MLKWLGKITQVEEKGRNFRGKYQYVFIHSDVFPSVLYIFLPNSSNPHKRWKGVEDMNRLSNLKERRGRLKTIKNEVFSK